MYFKTSHVIVYLNLSLYLKMIYMYFKTSHVIVYPFATIVVSALCIISKHLMLLFIIVFLLHCWFFCFASFIFCYCLSLCSCCSAYCFYFISKHLMLLFIIMRQHMFKMVFMYFKTSHVIVYPSHFRVFSFSPPLFPLPR